MASALASASASASAVGMRAGNGVRGSRRLSGRPIPKRGQVKVAIAVGLAHSVASLLSRSGRSLSFPRLSRAVSLLGY